MRGYQLSDGMPSQKACIFAFVAHMFIGGMATVIFDSIVSAIIDPESSSLAWVNYVVVAVFEYGVFCVIINLVFGPGAKKFRLLMAYCMYVGGMILAGLALGAVYYSTQSVSTLFTVVYIVTGTLVMYALFWGCIRLILVPRKSEQVVSPKS